MNEIVREGEKKFDRWTAAIEGVNQSKRSLNIAETELANAQNDLGRWMCPEDGRIGETFCVWHGDSLISVTKKDGSGNGSYEVKVRKRGRKTKTPVVH